MLLGGRTFLGAFISGTPEEFTQTLHVAYYYLAVMSVFLPTQQEQLYGQASLQAEVGAPEGENLKPADMIQAKKAAGRTDRIRKGMRAALLISLATSAFIAAIMMISA